MEAAQQRLVVNNKRAETDYQQSQTKCEEVSSRGMGGEEAAAAQHYQVGNYTAAAECYTLCLQQPDLPPHTRLGLLHNRSATYLRLKLYSKVLEDCNEILTGDAGNTRAFARKIKAFCGEGKFTEAHDMALQWERLYPTNEQAKREVERLGIVLKALQDQDADEDGLVEDVVIERRQPPEGEESESSATLNGAVSMSSTANTGPAAAPQAAAAAMQDADDLYQCNYCDVGFTSNSEFRAHCQSEEHQTTVSSDEGKAWLFRPPPRGLTSEEYTKCPRFCEDGSCRFGDQCSQAHSNEELAEWRRRFEYRRQRLQKAKDSEMMQGSSFAEQLLEKWMSAQNPDLILTDNAESINIHVNTDLSVTMASKKGVNSWTFTVTSKVCLRRIVLLDDAHRRHFHIHSITVGPKRAQKSQKIDEQCQEWINSIFTGTRSSNEKVYRIKVTFKTDIYGTFRQSVVFDFGMEPMLVRQLCVDSSPVVDIDRLQQDLVLNEAGRWDLSTKALIGFEPRPHNFDESDCALLEKYPPPMAAKFIVSDVLLKPDIKQETYKTRMHDMLYIEEMAQFSSIAKFNIRTSLHLVNRFLLMPSTVSTAKFAQGGELFARMKLNSDLSEDTSQGRLVLQNVSTVYFAPHDSRQTQGHPNYQPDTIYEALVEEKGKNFIFIRLSAKCVSDLGLIADTEIVAEVQFQLNRLPLCEMHQAIDLLPNLRVIFPAINTQAAHIPWNPQRQWNERLDGRLNLKQKEAIVAITTDLNQHLPPTLIVGPYGTGKTFTLAHAAKRILEQENTKVLICTHSNSAADLYVKEYLDPYVREGHPEAKPLRVYYVHRWVQTVNPTVLEYCLVGNEGTTGAMFRKPKKEDVDKHRIIVATLSTSRYLFSLDLPEGFFTHILLDEAAQAQECETIMPLVLAGPSTRVVLAGDHMQLGPEIHSDFARERGLHISFLERLYDHYPDSHSCKILLCENYRSHKAIINYTSELFYNRKLVASGKQPRHEVFYPLTFFTARGEDMQHQNSTAFYNNSEVYEVVERVVELQRLWPKAWGPLDENSIGVVSPYYDQVIRIRAELRKKKLFSVSVERVLNVQGKQFRAIFLSTVRTRNTCSSDIHLEEYIDYGFLSNVKLLNTAITRAQSLVAVIGDPVSLCSIGKCRKLWERFIELCHENTSLYGITWTQLRAQLDGVELKKTYVLNPNAPEFIPNRLRHGAFVPLEPVPMGRYGYTFISQPQSAPGVMPVPQPPPWSRPPFAPAYQPQMYRPSRYYGYPMMWGSPAYMTPSAKVTGPSIHLSGGGSPTSLSMAAMKAGTPVIQAQQNKRKADTPVSPHRALASPAALSPNQTESKTPVSSHAAGAPLQVRAHYSLAAPLPSHHPNYYRMTYMPSYGPAPFYPHMPMAAPYSMMMSPGSMAGPMPQGYLGHTLQGAPALRPVRPQPHNEPGTSNYQFLPNACNVNMRDTRSETPEQLPAAVTRLLGTDHQALLNNHHLQRELYSYIQQVEGSKSAAAFMNYIQQQLKLQQQHQDVHTGTMTKTKSTTASKSPIKPNAKREVVSVRRLEEPPPTVSPVSNGELDMRKRSDSSFSSATHSSAAAGQRVTQRVAQAAHQANWLSFDASKPPFNTLPATYQKQLPEPFKNGKSLLSTVNSNQNQRSCWQGQLSVETGTDEGDPLRDPDQLLAVNDMMRFIEESLDDEASNSRAVSTSMQQGTTGVDLSQRPVPLYMRGAVSEASTSQQTTMSYAGALRSQPPVSTSPSPSTSATLTAAQQASRTHLMTLLQGGAQGGSAAATMHPWPACRPILPHPDNQLQEQQQQQPDSNPQDIPPNPLDLLKNLHIKASPGTQALYQYFS